MADVVEERDMNDSSAEGRSNNESAGTRQNRWRAAAAAWFSSAPPRVIRNTWQSCVSSFTKKGDDAGSTSNRRQRCFSVCSGANRPHANTSTCVQVLSCLKTNVLTILSVLGVILGIAIAVIMRVSRQEKWTEREIAYVGFCGELFLRMLKCLIVPLIVSSLVSAVGSLDLSVSGRMGTRTVVYYMTTTLSAIALGIILVVSIHPGQGSEEGIKRYGTARHVTATDMLMDLVRNLFPPNLVQATFAQYKTVLTPPDGFHADTNGTLRNLTTGGADHVNGSRSTSNLYEWKMSGEWENSTNILGLVVFSLVLGIVLGKLGPKGRPLLHGFVCLSEAMMKITGWVIWFSPVGVLSLVAAETLRTENWNAVLGQLGMYYLTVMLGLFIHGFLVLFSVYFFITRQLPFRFVGNMSEALATAFATSSSSATLPVALACLEDKNGVDPRVSRFVMPIGATINMDGTALYEAVAAIFISQVHGMQLTLGNIVAISVTSTAASIGAAGIPQAGVVTMVMVLDVLGLPAEDVTLILAVDWLLDRFRTFTNVLGDSLGAGIVQHLSRSELETVPSPSVKVDVAENEQLEMAVVEKGEANGPYELTSKNQPTSSASTAIDIELQPTLI